MRRISLLLVVCLYAGLGLVEVRAKTGAGWDRFEFSGNATFSDQQLIDALVEDLDFLVATHPRSDFQDLPDVVQQLLSRGYQRAGFPDAKVVVTADPDTRGAKIEFHEGVRFRQGRVRIEGAEKIGADRLRRRLTEPYPGDDAIQTISMVAGKPQPHWVDKAGKPKALEEPVWELGIPTRFDDLDGLQKKVDAALRDLGYSNAQFEFELVNNERTKRTELRVRIASAGQPDQIDQVVIAGLVKHSQQRVLQHLGIGPAQKAHGRLIQQVNQRLWNSGRFDDQRVELARDAENEPLVLKIHVKEVPGVPLLGERLSAEGETLLKARTWIADALVRGEDLVVEVDTHAWSGVIVQSQQGQLAHITHKSAEEPFYGAFLMDGGQLLVYLSTAERKFHTRFRGGEHQLSFHAGIGAAADPDRLWAVTLGAGFTSNREPSEPPIVFSIDLHPSKFLPFAYKANLEHAWKGDTLISSRRDATNREELRIDKRTGKFEVRGPQGRLTFQTGRYLHEQQAIQQRIGSLPNTADAQRPASSLVEYCCDPTNFNHMGAATEHSRIVEVLGAVGKLAAGGVLAPVDRIVTRGTTSQADGEDEFRIPLQPPSGAAPPNMFSYLAAKVIVAAASELFPEGSWPLLVARESGFVVLGRTQHTSALLQQIYTDDRYGPLCHATVSQLLLKVKPGLSERFASRGLEQLNAEAFERDYRDLVTGEFGKWMSDVIAALQSFSPEELEAVASLIKNQRAADVLRRMHLAENRGAGIDDGAVWFDAVKEELAHWLQTQMR